MDEVFNLNFVLTHPSHQVCYPKSPKWSCGLARFQAPWGNLISDAPCGTAITNLLYLPILIKSNDLILLTQSTPCQHWCGINPLWTLQHVPHLSFLLLCTKDAQSKFVKNSCKWNLAPQKQYVRIFISRN